MNTPALGKYFNNLRLKTRKRSIKSTSWTFLIS